MPKKVKLREIAHSRAGDKGNINNIGLVAYSIEHYPILVEQVTIDKVKELYKGTVKGKVERFELPEIGALNFVLHDSLGGGVSRTLGLDTYGKALSSAILTLEVEIPD